MSAPKNKQKGFTLIELLITLALLAVLAIMIVVAINPVEQLKRAKDTRRKVYANELLRAVERYQASKGENPALDPIIASIDCGEVVSGNPVSDLSDLQDELSSWFPARIAEPEDYLYVGILPKSGLTKVCYQVESITTRTRFWDEGCSASSKFYLCLPN